MNLIALLVLSLSFSVRAETNFERNKYSRIVSTPSRIQKSAETLEPRGGCGPRESCIYQYSSFQEIKSYKKELLQEIVQRMADQIQGKGYRHLGEHKDFDHCHLLMGRTKKPFAALCHTQELAEQNPGTEFDYIDKQSRNWVVWLDGSGRIENAITTYRYDQQPKSWKYPITFDEYLSKGTVTPFMIDPKKIDHDILPDDDVEFIFTKSDCPQVSRHKFEESNHIRIKQKDHSEICLILEDIPCHDRVSTCKARCMNQEFTH